MRTIILALIFVASFSFAKDRDYQIASYLGHGAAMDAVPADDKENARLIVSRIVLDTLQDLKMAYPKTTEKHRLELKAIGKELAEEKQREPVVSYLAAS